MQCTMQDFATMLVILTQIFTGNSNCDYGNSNVYAKLLSFKIKDTLCKESIFFSDYYAFSSTRLKSNSIRE